jgi:hypothetical protein
MAFRSVGINLPRLYLEDVSDLTDDLEALKIAGADSWRSGRTIWG